MIDPDDVAEMDDFNVIPRPAELVERQLKSSAKLPFAKSTLKMLFQKKDKSKISKQTKSQMDSQFRKKSSKRVFTDEQDRHFQASVQEAHKKLHRKNKEPSSKLEEHAEEMSMFSTTTGLGDGVKEYQLLKILNLPAFTDKDRLTVLSARDNLIRIRESKPSDSKKGKIVGTCPDMCPERERYRRTEQKCLSLLEFKEGVPNHHLMIKEYSRSSADQQEPLPNELRPITVLQLTMDHLICNVIGQLRNDRVSISDWYDFVWNRTRAIRKDITQQQICSIDCVEIIEKCIRFHILCAELLSEEDRSTFDPKINNENLNKSLQTLKHMYHDLQSKGIQCPNEAEFRAYDILLSLTEGEALRLVKDVRKEIFKSPVVKSAFSAALAFHSNNYVLFFRLMERSSYLSSCIMHRFMGEARVRAIQVMIRALCTQQTPTLYPLSALVRDLKFESREEAAIFCNWHNLKTDEHFVTLQRMTFQFKENPFPVRRSHVLVGSKLGSGFGEIVNNGHLPKNPLFEYHPSNSFNEKGIISYENYIPDISPEAELIVSTSVEEVVFQPDIYSDEFSPQSEPMDDDDEIFLLDDEESIPQEVDLISVADTKGTESSIFTSTNTEFPSTTFSMLASNSAKPSIRLSQTFFPPPTESTPFSFQAVAETPKLSETSPQVMISEEESAASPRTSVTTPFSSDVFSLPSSCFVASDVPKQIVAPLTSPRIDRSLKSFSWKSLPDKTKTPVPSEVSSNASSDMLKEDSTCLLQAKTNIEAPVVESHIIENVLEPDPNIEDSLLDDDFAQSESNSGTPTISPAPSFGAVDLETLEQIRFEKINELVSDIQNEIYSDCIGELSTEICTEIFREEGERKQDFEDEMEFARTLLAEKVLFKWRLFVQRRKQRRSFQNNTPLSPWVPMLRNNEYVTSGASSPFSVYKKHCSFSKMAESKLQKYRTKPGWEPFVPSQLECHEIPKSFPPAYFKGIRVEKFFKFTLIAATENKDSFSNFSDWLCAKFKMSSVPGDENDKQVRFFSASGGKVVVCIEFVFLNPSTNRVDGGTNHLKGVSGVILFVPEKFSDSKVSRTVLFKLNVILRESCLSPFPLQAYLLPSAKNYNAVNDFAVHLEKDLHPSGSLSKIKMDQLKDVGDYVNNSKEILRSLIWLMQNHEMPPLALCSSVRFFLEDSYASAFNTLLWKISFEEFKPLVQLPHIIVEFYNLMLSERAQVLISNLLSKVSENWPPPEVLILQPDYRFVEMNRQKECLELMQSMLLPEFEGNADSISDLWQFVQKVEESTVNPSTGILSVSIRSILESATDDIDWCSVISKCAYHVISSRSCTVSELLEKDVYFMKEDLEAIDLDWFWQILSKSIQECTQEPLSESELPKSRKRSAEEYEYHQEKIPKLDYFAKFADIPNSSLRHVDNVFTSLRATLDKQKDESEKWTDILNASVLETEFEEDQSVLKNLPDEEISTPKDSFEDYDSRVNASSNEKQNESYSQEFAGAVSWKSALSQSKGLSSTATIFEKLAELKYNIQKNNIIEDNLSSLLDLS